MQLLHRSRRSLVLLLTLGLVALNAPAKAALPTSSPTGKHRCANGKTAKDWLNFEQSDRQSPSLSRLAVDNPCKNQWFQVFFRGLSESSPYGLSVFIAPGQRFNWEGRFLSELGLDLWEEIEFESTGLVAPKSACVRNFEGSDGWTGFRGLLIFNEKDVRNAPECGQPVPKYQADRMARVDCTSPDPNYALAVWKTDTKKNLIKLAIYNNNCSAGWVIAWWELDNGRKVGVWVEPGEKTDLWLDELDGLPTKMKDGRVHIGTDRTLGVDVDDFGGSNPKKRPFYYNFVANGDHVAGGSA